MPANCAVGGCGSNYRHKLPNISFHPFPEDVELRKKWMEVCQTKENPSSGRVCSRHFKDDDFERILRYELLNLPVPKNRKTLKTGRIPTLFLPSTEDHQHRVNKMDHTNLDPREVEVVEVKEEQPHSEESQEVHPLQEHDPLSIKPDPVSWELAISDPLERLDPEEEIEIKEEKIQDLEIEVDMYVTDRAEERVSSGNHRNDLLQKPRHFVWRARNEIKTEL